MPPSPVYFIIDFDSTFIRTESLDELAAIVLRGDPERKQKLARFKQITEQGMEGAMGFDESLTRRLKIIRPTRAHIDKLIKSLRKKISPSIARNKNFFKQFADHIYIVSGGFREFVAPVVAPFGIADDHILANSFTFDTRDRVTGLDSANVLSRKDGKIAAIRALDLHGDIVAIGDGYTDYQIKAMGVAKHFIAFTENVTRHPVAREADHIAPSFDEIL